MWFCNLQVFFLFSMYFWFCGSFSGTGWMLKLPNVILWYYQKKKKIVYKAIHPMLRIQRKTISNISILKIRQYSSFCFKIFFDVHHLLNLLLICCSYFMFWFFWPWGMWDLSSLTRNWTSTPCIGRWSPNHWIAREVPIFTFSPPPPTICCGIRLIENFFLLLGSNLSLFKGHFNYLKDNLNSLKTALFPWADTNYCWGSWLGK